MGLVGDVVTLGGGRGGFALAGVLLTILLLTAMALSAAAVSHAQLRSSSAALKLLSARAAAEAAIEAQVGKVLGSPPGLPGSLSNGAIGLMGDLPWALLDYRIDSEFHAFVGEASVVGTSSLARVARLVWWMDPASRVRGFSAVVESASILVDPEAVISGADPLGSFGVHPGCEDNTLLAAAFPGPIPIVGPLPEPPDWGAEEGSGIYSELRLGWYDARRLTQIADVTLAPSSSLAVCPGCWLGLVVAPGHVVLSGGGAGVLIVLGSVALESDATWTGLIVAGRDVAVRTRARVTGMIRSGGIVSVADSASIEGSACAAYRSLEAAGTLLRPIRLPGPTRLGPLPPSSN